MGVYKKEKLLNVIAKEEKIKENYKKIIKLNKELALIRQNCHHDVLICVEKENVIFGKDVYIREKNICLECGAQEYMVNNRILVDMSNYEVDYKNYISNSERQLLKVDIIRKKYIDILLSNPGITKEELYEKLSDFAIKKEEKVLKKNII